MLHRCYCPLMIIHQWQQWIIWILSIAFFSFGGVAHSTRSSRKSFRNLHFYIPLSRVNCVTVTLCLSSIRLHSVSDCKSFCVLFCARLRNNKLPFCQSDYNAHNFLFNNSKGPAACQLYHCNFKWIRAKGSNKFFFPVAFVRNERDNAERRPKALCCVYIPNYHCNKLQLNERLYCSVGDIHSFQNVRFKWMANFSRWQIKKRRTAKVHQIERCHLMRAKWNRFTLELV